MTTKSADTAIFVDEARRTTIEHCARIAEEVAAETGDGEGEIYIARKIADRIRGLLSVHLKKDHANEG